MAFYWFLKNNYQVKMIKKQKLATSHFLFFTDLPEKKLNFSLNIAFPLLLDQLIQLINY